MSLTPIQSIARPQGAHWAAWQQADMPPAFAFVLDHFWHHRVVGWVGYPEETLLVLDRLWDDLASVTDPDGLVNWTALVREALWGTLRFWSEEVELTGSEQELSLRNMQKARARFLLGEALFEWVAEDAWQLHIEKLNARNPSYDDLQRLHASRFRERLAAHPVHPEPEGGYSLRQIRRLARHLVERFGFRSLATAGGMPLSDVWSALREAEVGLGAMAQALRWEEGSIGGQRVGLAFELDRERPLGKQNPSGHYDPELSLIHIGRRGGWGSFAHEWGHALDEAVGLGWYPKATGLQKFASVRAEDPHTVLRRSGAELAAFRTRDVPVLSHAQSFQALRQSIEAFPQQLRAFRDRLPHAEWDERLSRRLASLEPWRQAVLQGRGTPRQWQEQWRRWKRDNDVAFSIPDSSHAQAWKLHWDRTIEVAETIFFGPWPGRPSWRAWSAARDRIEAMSYWDTPHEAFARMIHALVRQGVGSDTWVAEAPLQADVFPQGADLAASRAWWMAQSELLAGHWGNPPVNLQLAWAGCQLVLR